MKRLSIVAGWGREYAPEEEIEDILPRAKKELPRIKSRLKEIRKQYRRYDKMLQEALHLIPEMATDYKEITEVPEPDTDEDFELGYWIKCLDKLFQVIPKTLKNIEGLPYKDELSKGFQMLKSTLKSDPLERLSKNIGWIRQLGQRPETFAEDLLEIDDTYESAKEDLRVIIQEFSEEDEVFERKYVDSVKADLNRIEALA